MLGLSRETATSVTSEWIKSGNRMCDRSEWSKKVHGIFRKSKKQSSRGISRKMTKGKATTGMVKITSLGKDKDKEIRESNKKLVSENKFLRDELEKLMTRFDAMEKAQAENGGKMRMNSKIATSNRYETLVEDEGDMEVSNEAQTRNWTQNRFVGEEPSQQEWKKKRPVAQVPYSKKQEQIQMEQAKAKHQARQLNQIGQTKPQRVEMTI